MNFGGRRVLTLESRRASEMATLVTTYGGAPVVAPAVQEAPLESNTAALDFCAAVVRGDVDVAVLLTGVGTRALIRLGTSAHGAAFTQALERVALVARGPKPIAALREAGLQPRLTAAPPHTWHEVIAALDAQTAALPLRGARVAIQEYGAPNPALARELEARGAIVTTVPVYEWRVPDDTTPLEDAARAIAGDDVDVLLLTSSVQLVHLLQIASRISLDADVRRGLTRMVIVSIGPVTSEELRRHGFEPDMEPTTARMGVLVREAAERCEELIRNKGGRRKEGGGRA